MLKEFYFSVRKALPAISATIALGLFLSFLVGFLSFTSGISFFSLAVYSIFLSGSISISNILLLNRYNQASPSQLKTRIFSQLINTFFAVSAIALTFSAIISYTFVSVGFFKALAVSLFLGLPAAAVFEGFILVDFLAEWKNYILQSEAVKLEKVKIQLESLKHQVSPHFFFNSLNSLALVIEEDQEEAVKYVHHIASLYRYLMQSKETAVVTLAEELKFAETYIYMQRMRFGPSLDMTVSIDQDQKKTLIPPLTLYILLENAIKHNIITKSKPLHINVCINDGKLQICNNIQMRSIAEEKADVGLRNVRTSYESISVLPMQVSTDNDNFTVALPLIKELSRSA
ncbi:MAG: hypothetical protein EOP53_09515 [Sphingobacteriales bacterium]|nr:MAG: hypothetical protein EOP53_09515 [Sphingobacteriales bacterium]